MKKQPPEVFHEKRCSKKFRKIHRKTPVSETFLIKQGLTRPATLKYVLPFFNIINDRIDPFRNNAPLVLRNFVS